jgi:hypothetical protein
MGSWKLIAILFLAGCLGPRPAVAEIHLSPQGRDGSYRVDLSIENQGRGQGQAAVTIRLRNRKTGATIQKSEKVTLRGLEHTRLIADIVAPPATYDVDASVEYPPR